jgi:hypothetical protein
MGNNTIKMHLVLHMADDILDHGDPQNFNSAFTESAHIPLSKDTSRNTQKPLATFTVQAAWRYVEDVSISMCFPNDTDPLGNMTRNKIPSVNEEEDTTSGRGFKIQQKPCGTVECQWLCKQKTDHSNLTVNVDRSITTFLTQYCLPAMPNGTALPCFIEFDCVHTETTYYRAHLQYMGKPWYDYAMTD